MLRFSAQFPVDPSGDCAEIWPLARAWLLGSPHTSLTDESLVAPTDANWAEFRHNDEVVIFACGKVSGYTSYGVEYTKREAESRLTWRTQVVGTQDAEKFWISVAVSCDSPLAGIRIPSPKKPYIIRQILDHFGGGRDADFLISQEPQHLADSDVGIVAKVINGVSAAQMPVVYVSRCDDNGLVVDVDELAKWVAGMAHVLVEPSRAFSFRLRDLTSARNVYAGSVGIYWPEGIESKLLHPWGQYEDPQELMKAASHAVRHGLIGQRQIEQCTWSHLRELRARAQLETLKASDSSSVEEYVKAFDEELRLKDERLNRAERELDRLRALLRAQPDNRTHSGDPVLIAGKEHDLYDTEIRGIVHDILNDAVANSHDGSRRKHILQDLLGANSSGHHRDEILRGLRQAFTSYKKMTSQTRTILQELGFSLEEDGKHYKITFCNDPRYHFVVPKTSSDHRAGKNLISQIKNDLL